MEKINFINNQQPALNATNLNQLQDNVEDAISQVGTGIKVYKSSAQSLPNATVTTITFDSTSFKTNDNLTLTDNKIVIGSNINTILVNGRWGANSPTSAIRYCYVQKNGTTISYTEGSYDGTVSNSIILPVSENDYITLACYQTEASSISIRNLEDRTFLEVIVLN